MIKLLIFDLDGTLLDTIQDLAIATNRALSDCGFPVHPLTDYRHFVGNGIRKLFERALPAEACTEENIEKIREHFLAYYDVHCCDYTQPYPEIPEVLEQLNRYGIQTAIASNKYQKATEKLISHFFPTIKFTAVFGQRPDVPLKPNPAVTNEIMTVAGVTREETLYIGDSCTDRETARNAGLTFMAVSWGFCPREELEVAVPDYLIDDAKEILRISVPHITIA